jgi:predicted nucleotidyltransferase
MDVSHPIRAVVPTLDGPVLEVLARTTSPLTGREVHRLLGIGSLNGVRLALSRLVRQGLVRVEERAAAYFYLANRDHLAWPAVETLAGIRHSLVERLREELRSWVLQPSHASMFGSTARGDGDDGSDIDILLIRPDQVGEDDSPWADQVDRLRDLVQAWTGNHCQVFQLDLARLSEHVSAQDPLIGEWRRDAVKLAGEDLRVILRRLRAVGGRS